MEINNNLWPREDRWNDPEQMLEALGLDRLNDYTGDYPMEQEWANKILNQHETWINSKGKAGERADFSECDVSYLDLSNKDLRGANFRYADCRYADFTGSKLESTDFSHAKVRGTNFENAKWKADLRFERSINEIMENEND